MGADTNGANGYVDTDGSGRYGYVGVDILGRYWYVGMDVIVKKIVNQKFDFDCVLIFLRGEKKHFILIHLLHMPITTIHC